MLEEIVKVLQPWESSKLDIKCAKAILDKVEELGMRPPLHLAQKTKRKKK